MAKKIKSPYYLYEITGLRKKNPMYELIRFMPVEIMSCACFFCGRKKKSGMEIFSIVLIPYDKSGKVVVTEFPFPEIFLQ
jgi:hypothetical protein